jgi:SAM-dependent methyltransferase
MLRWALVLGLVTCADDAEDWSSEYMRQHMEQGAKNVKRYFDRRSTGEDAVPGKHEDQWTVTAQFRADLQAFVAEVGGAERQTVLEVGSYMGYTTRLLSELFFRVITLDAVPALLAINRDFNQDKSNIVFIQFHTGDDNWEKFSLNRIDAVLLDASHDYGMVVSDISKIVQYLPGVRWIAFDDYSAEPGVKQAIDQYIATGVLQPVRHLGESNYRVPDGRLIEGPEGIVCAVVK